MSALHAAATELAAQGFRVFPLKHRDKVPATKNGLHDASDDAEQVARWFGKSPELNLAIRTGDDCWVLDVDGPAGEESLAKLVAEHGELPATAEVRTGKGRQLYFTLPADVEIRNRAGVLPGVDVRGGGGYVVAPPSIHPNGKPYTWTRPLAALTDAPRWLVELVLSKPAELPAAERNGSHEGNGYDTLFARARQYAATIPPAAEGTRNHYAFKLGGSLAALEGSHSERLSRADVLNLVRGWNQLNSPPLGDAELVKAVDSARSNGKPPGPKLRGSKPPKKLAPLPARRAFPVDALPEPLRGFVVAEAKAKCVPPEMVALPVLCAAAAAIGGSRTLELRGGWREPCLLWGCVVAEPSTNKTAPFKAALAPLEDTEDRWAAEHAQTMQDHEKRRTVYEAQLSAWKRKPDGNPPAEPEAPSCRRIIVSDITTEALAVRLQENYRGLLLAMDEMAGWLASYDAYRQGRGGDAQRWLSIWSAGRIVVDRKTGGTVRVPRAIVSVCGTVQPETLRRAFGTEHIDDGLAARLLVAYPPTTAVRWTDAQSHPEVTRRYAECLDRLLMLPTQAGDDPFDARRPYVVRLSAEAKAAFVPWHDRVAAEAVEQAGALRSVWGKLRGYAARLALVCHAVRAAMGKADDLTLDAESMRAGMMLAEWFGNEARRLFLDWNGDDDERELRRLAEWIAERGGSVTVRDLSRNAPRRWRGDAAQCHALLNRLAQAGLGEWVTDPASGEGGQPVSRLKLLPAGDTTPENPEEFEVVSPVANDSAHEFEGDGEAFEDEIEVVG